MTAVMRIRCKEHPNYQAKRKPRIGCGGCWYMWSLLHEEFAFYAREHKLLFERAGK